MRGKQDEEGRNKFNSNQRPQRRARTLHKGPPR